MYFRYQFLKSVFIKFISISTFFYLSLALAEGDLAKLLNTDDDALHARIALIESAQESIDMSYYIFKNESTGNIILNRLIAAANRGVKVRLFLDMRGYSAKDQMPHSLLNYLKDKGIEVKLYDPMSITNLHGYNTRMHDKLVITDSKTVIVGGRNIKNSYFTDRKAGRIKFIDLDLMVKGDADGIKEAQSYFNELWSHKWAKLPNPKSIAKGVEKAKYDSMVRNYNRFFRKYMDKYGEKVSSSIDQMMPVKNLVFGRDVPALKGKELGSAKPIIDLINSAKERVVFEAAYLVLFPELSDAIEDAVKRGVKVNIVTNSAMTNDVKFGSLAYVYDRDKLLNSGINFWEFMSPEGEKGTLHAKSLIVDDSKIYVGTFNFDPRSMYLNLEIGYSADSAELVDSFENRLAARGDNIYYVLPEELRKHQAGIYGARWNEEWRGAKPGYREINSPHGSSLVDSDHPNVNFIKKQAEKNASKSFWPTRASCQEYFFKMLIRVPIIRKQL